LDIIQTFYNDLASDYDKLFMDWDSTVKEQALILDRLIKNNGYDKSCNILDCACGIGTQAIGIAALGYDVTASDISDCELKEAMHRAEKNGVNICFENADFRMLSEKFSRQFDVIIAMDNALPHMLTKADLEDAAESIMGRLKPGGMFIASIRDYDALLSEKPLYSPPYIHKTEAGQRVSFQTWSWSGDCYRLIQYIIDDDKTLGVSRFECEYRAVRRGELTEILISKGADIVEWKFPEETGFYQPIVVAKKK